MAVAGLSTKTYVKATSGAPIASDLLTTNESTDFNRTRAELETNYQGVAFSSLILGRSSCETSVTVDYDAADAGFAPVDLFETCHESGATLYITVDVAGTGAGKQVGVKVVGLQFSSPQDGKLTMTPTLRSCTAVSDVTIV